MDQIKIKRILPVEPIYSKHNKELDGVIVEVYWGFKKRLLMESVEVQMFATFDFEIAKDKAKVISTVITEYELPKSYNTKFEVQDDDTIKLLAEMLLIALSHVRPVFVFTSENTPFKGLIPPYAHYMNLYQTLKEHNNLRQFEDY